MDPSNYRPISITPTVSKIIESAIKKQVSTYLIDNDLVSGNQFAYLSGRSAQTALHSIIHPIIKNIGQGHVNAICTLDMDKGFDTISHNILLHKLSFYGFDGNSMNFFTSSLSNRCQKVKYGSLVSKENSVELVFLMVQFGPNFIYYICERLFLLFYCIR